MSKKSIVIPGVNLNPVDVDSATIEILEIKWDLEDKARVRLVEARSVETQIIEDEIIVIGKVTNLSGGIVNVVRVTALLLNKEGDILSASATQVKSIGVNDTSSFKIFFPTLSELSLEDTEFQTKVFTEVIPAL